jgi:hypothetical protein
MSGLYWVLLHKTRLAARRADAIWHATAMPVRRGAQQMLASILLMFATTPAPDIIERTEINCCETPARQAVS